MPGFEAYDHRERDAALAIFEEGNVLFSHGFAGLRKKYHVYEFNEICQNYFGVKNAISVSSGTAGIKVALKAAGIKSGDEVITQGFNFIATIEAIIDCGAIPIIAPIDDHLNIDIEKTKTLVNEKTKAIIIVHMLGFPGDVNALYKFTKENKIILIEDNCEAIGSTINNKYCGGLADIGVFSFDHGKMIATGEGGMILTNSNYYADFIRSYIDHGHMNDKRFPRGKDPKRCIGFNYRMTELQGAIGKVQLTKLQKMLSDNKKRYEVLNTKLSNFYEERKLIDQAVPTYDTYMFKVPNQSKRNRILKSIYDNKFGTKNIPDAMEWHCSFFWQHALSHAMVEASREIFDKLNEYIAIPILLKLPLTKYEQIANLILEEN